jgi:hypothetical protein
MVRLNNSQGGGSGGSLFLETNGTPNGSQALLNLIAGSNITLTDDGIGDITISSTSGSPSIGGTITGGTTNSILFVNPSATLAQDTTNFNYTAATATLFAQNISLGNGSGVAQSLIFGSDTVGWFRQAANTWGFGGAGGTLYYKLSSTGIVGNPTGSFTLTRLAGTATTPTYSFTGTTNTGMFLSGTSLAFSTAGTVGMSLDTSNNLTVQSLTNGLVKSTTGLLSNATAGTDYTTPTGTEALSNKTITTSSVNGVTLTTGGGTTTFLNANGTYSTPAGGGGGITIGTTTITSGTSGRILYDNAGVVGEMTTTGSGTVAVLATSPTLVTPVLGVASATTINKITFTQPATGATLTLVDGSSLITSGAFAATLTSTAATNATLPAGTTNLATIVPQVYGATQGRYQLGGYSNGVSATNSTVSSGVLYALPFMVTKTTTVTTMASDIETNVTGNAEMGIYADNGNGLPGALVLDAGNFSTNSLGTRTITGLTTVLTPGQYWVAIVYSATPGVKGYPNNGLIPTLGSGSTINAASTNFAMVTMSQAYGALPSTFSTTPTYVSSAPYPIVGMLMT